MINGSSFDITISAAYLPAKAAARIAAGNSPTLVAWVLVKVDAVCRPAAQAAPVCNTEEPKYKAIDINRTKIM